MNRLTAFVLTALLLASLGVLRGADSIGSLEEAIQGLGPGVTVQVADGDYKVTRPIRIQGKRGTAEVPIILRAEHRGRAVIGGAAGFVIRDCEYLILEGFMFTSDADQQAVRLDNCRHVRVTRNTFRLTERATPRHWEHWVTVEGARSGQNRIDHNLFERKVNRGSHVFIRGDDALLVCSQHDRVDRNHFQNVVYANGENGHETIRTGGNDLGASGQSSFTLIEENLLERCSGEDEIMSLKSSDNVVRNNTLLNCRGAICLRLGNRDIVSGNFIIATNGEPGCGGVKLYGFDHRVFNNYFFGLTGRRHEAPLGLIPGTLDTPTTENIGKKYDDMTSVPPTRCWIAFNTWIDCVPLQFGFNPDNAERMRIPPNECTFVNNLVVRTKPQALPLVNFEVVRGLRAHDNLGYTCQPVVPRDEWAGWFRFADPHLRQVEGAGVLWRLTDSSPAIDAAVEGTGLVDDDVFGRVRSGWRDIGAEEFGSGALRRRPLTSGEVGPDAP
ncbi:MAG: polysaccharide lyase 6 family protein [Verrucomicrobiota bacterium]